MTAVGFARNGTSAKSLRRGRCGSSFPKRPPHHLPRRGGPEGTPADEEPCSSHADPDLHPEARDLPSDARVHDSQDGRGGTPQSETTRGSTGAWVRVKRGGRAQATSGSHGDASVFQQAALWGGCADSVLCTDAGVFGVFS